MEDVIMEAGRELDLLIAEKVMDLKPVIIEHKHPYLGTFVLDQNKLNPEVWTPHYSTDIAAAWTVVDKITSMQNVVCINQSMYVGIDGSNVHGHDCSINANGWGSGKLKWAYRTGKSAAHAICLAALDAI